MKGAELKKKLRLWNVNLRKLAADAGYRCEQNLHSNLSADDVKSGVIERIAKTLNRRIADFYEDDTFEDKLIRNLESTILSQQKTIENQQNTIAQLTTKLNDL